MGWLCFFWSPASGKTCEDGAVGCILSLHTKNTPQSPEEAVKRIMLFWFFFVLVSQ